MNCEYYEEIEQVSKRDAPKKEKNQERDLIDQPWYARVEEDGHP